MALMFRVGDFGRTFATRERGEELRLLLLEKAEGHDRVVVDFDGVVSVSYSFADEFLGKLRAEGPVRLEQQNLSPRVADIARRAVERRTAVSC